MSKVLWNYLLVIPALFGGLVVLSSAASAAEVEKTAQPTQQVIPIDKITPTGITERTSSESSFEPSDSTSKVPVLTVPSDRIEQVTSVSQLSDVQPTDWAFQALQSLVERYGVIAGYPDGTFKGNRALTRYEFAAGLNAALDRLNELIVTSTGDLVRKEDLTTLQKLQEQFASELATLRGRVDALETRQAKVEANQFSTTTKLVGDATFLVADTFGDRANNTAADDTNDGTQTFFAYRARLNFQTSFTGRDQLTTLLTAGNNIPNLGATTGTQMTRFTIDGDGRADTYLSQLTYRFPLGSKATVWVGPRALQPATFTPTLNGAIAGLNGAISRFATFNHTVYRPGFDGAGLALGYKFSDQLQLSLGYIADNNQAPNPGRGLFNGTNLALAQLTVSPTRQLDFGLTYARKYYTDNTTGADPNFNVTGGTGSAFARNPFEQNSTTTDNFGFQFNWRTTRSLTLGGWFGYTRAHQNRGGDSDATIINTALTVGFPDLLKKGNVGGIIVGIPPKVTSSDYRSGAGILREDPSTSLHIEAFYTYRVNDNITITPDFYVITKPEHNDNNDPIWVGALRTTFTF
ncbi:iron uptake porin [Nostoc edaphicum CCNP1411]|uniref:Iron uptake porin n=1 Tax=Nostoc edaphicum CCNP1411 TaxID=1472755 RepID=A0A7D7QIY8_9NOSO|nr:iron uptake porin [Nostoc edaphicum]QMS88281.1 iron uptake porin [Nostoc edaphicum CCNP1411]